MDATRLRQGLSEYLNAVDRQLVEMRDQRGRLETTWQRTSQVYQGAGAEAFADAFGRAMRMLESYVEMLELVTPLLKSRIDALDRFDSAAAPEP